MNVPRQERRRSVEAMDRYIDLSLVRRAYAKQLLPAMHVRVTLSGDY